MPNNGLARYCTNFKTKKYGLRHKHFVSSVLSVPTIAARLVRLPTKVFEHYHAVVMGGGYMYTVRIYYAHTRLTRVVCVCSIIYTERTACYPQEYNFFLNFKRYRISLAHPQNRHCQIGILVVCIQRLEGQQMDFFWSLYSLIEDSYRSFLELPVLFGNFLSVLFMHCSIESDDL